MAFARACLIGCALLVGACKFPELPPVDETDSAAVDAPDVDAPAIDGPMIDGADIDAPPIDAPPIDAPPIDAAIDAPPIDAPPIDAPIDASAIDGPPIDAPSDGPPIDAPPPTFTVGGTVSGMWNGAEVALQIAAPPNSPELITVAANGAFTFPTGLPTGRSFTITVPAGGQPFMHNCVVQNPNGTVATANITNRVVVCTPQVTMSVSFTAPVVFAFDVGTTSYNSETADGVQETRMTVTVTGATSITINGGTVASGALSGIVSLRNPITVHVVVGAISQDYTFFADHSSIDFDGPVYAKSSNSGANDQQGAVSASGNLVAVGAPLEDSAATGVNGNQNSETSVDSGAVYIYRRVGLTWSQEAYLKPMINQAGAQFGASVSLHNEGTTAVLVVGSPAFDGLGANSGAAYVFRRSSAGVWTEEQRLQAAQQDTGSEFGTSVSINRGGPGYAVAIGAPKFGGNDIGAAYISRFSGGVWSQEKVLMAPNLEANDMFGGRVSVFGGVIAVGAAGEDSSGTGINSATQGDNGALESGAAYVFRRNGAGTDWIFEAYVKASNTGAGDAFGTGVSIENNVLVVGAPNEDSDGSSQANNGLFNAGAAYAFEFTGGVWSQINYLKHNVNSASTSFGFDVCVHGDLVLVGAPEINGTQDQSGFGRYFLRSGTSPFNFPGTVFRAPNWEQQDEYGFSVSCSGEGLFLGAHFEDSNARGFNMGLADNSAANSGATYGHY